MGKKLSTKEFKLTERQETLAPADGYLPVSFYLPVSVYSLLKRLSIEKDMPISTLARSAVKKTYRKQFAKLRAEAEEAEPETA